MNSSSSDLGLDNIKESDSAYLDDSRNPLLDVSLQPSQQEYSPLKSRWSCLTIANSVLFCFSVILLVINASITCHVPRDYCVKKLSFYCKSLIDKEKKEVDQSDG